MQNLFTAFVLVLLIVFNVIDHFRFKRLEKRVNLLEQKTKDLIVE